MTLRQGYNSDIEIRGEKMHVQTEDWGIENPFLVSRVFKNGAVLRSIKTPYASVLPRGIQSDSSSVQLAMEVQHQSILDLLLSGQLSP